MKVQNSTAPDSLSNFLNRGAFLHWQDEWIFIELAENPEFPRQNTPISVWSPYFFDLGQPLIQSHYWMRVKNGSQQLQSFEKNLQLCVENAKARSTGRPWSEPQLSRYQPSFEQVMHAITGGQIKKAVPFIRQQSPGAMTTAERAQILLHRLKQNESLFDFGFWEVNEGIIGATPELLFSRQGLKVQTMALAGTKPVSADLRILPKDHEEHQLVIDDIANVLQELGSVQTGKTEIVKYPNLMHLKTAISMQLSAPMTNQSLVERLHPTPALGVSPRNQMHWFKTLPGQSERRRYGAPILFAWDDTAVSLVCIRALEWDNDRSWLSAGGGVVKESTLEGEWNEIKTKLSSIWKNLGLAELSR